jgi:hypothetical protein
MAVLACRAVEAARLPPEETTMRPRFSCCIAFLVLALTGCVVSQPSATLTPTAQRPLATWTVEPTPTSQPTPPPEPTPTFEPTSTPVPPTVTLEPTPAATPTQTPAPPEQIAFYGAGPAQAPQLHALAADGATTTLELNVYQGAALSSSGRWIASPSALPSAPSAVITDLQGGTTYTIDATAGWGIYRMAFDHAEDRLAFLELGPAQERPIPWAIVVVDLVDGTTTRYEDTTRPDEGVYPGNPLAWVSGDRELLIGAFLPYSDGFYAGVKALQVLPGTASTPIASLDQRTLIPGGTYRSIPRLSPDGRRLLYLARDPDYRPADYTPVLDFAVNQLWALDIESATPTLLYEVTNGDALGGDLIGGAAAWAPSGERILFAQGHYAGTNWGSLALLVYDQTGQVQERAPLPLPEEGAGLHLAWCRPDTALAVLTAGPDPTQLYMVDVETADLKLLTTADTVFVLGCAEAP